MNQIDRLTLEEKFGWILGLSIDCPMCKALESCPAKELRKLPLRERYRIVRQMQEYQLDEIIEHHIQCLKERES